jgi:hypothetical protein
MGLVEYHFTGKVTLFIIAEVTALSNKESNPFFVFRWHSFMLGRPMSKASLDFDTQLPAPYDSGLEVDTEGGVFLPNVALFRLAFILGNIMTSTGSLGPVAYESVLENDRALTQWVEHVPFELDIDDFCMARSLASPILATRRLAVQNVVLRTVFHHIRIALHWSFAAPGQPYSKVQSLEIAASEASKLISFVSRVRCDFLPNCHHDARGHMIWGPVHCFSASIFFCSQLVGDPEQPGSRFFRQQIGRAMDMLNCSLDGDDDKTARMAYAILRALEPLFSQEYVDGTAFQREKQKEVVISAARQLPFPYKFVLGRWWAQKTSDSDSPAECPNSML